jgi:hypothetical protein
MRPWALWGATFGVATAGCLLGAEAMLRASDHAPERLDHPRPFEPDVHDPDPVLGWRTRPGIHRFPPYRLPGEAFYKTILPDGSRATGPHPGPDDRPELVLVGCSYTLGWAVGDADTWAWRLQERLPELWVRNFGAAGYSTFQSLLLLEELLPRLSAPSLVVYAMIQHHKNRNVADTGWLHTLELVARDDPAALPYVTLGDDGELRRHPPLRWPRPPLFERSALVRWLARMSLELSPRERMPRIAITERLLLEMDARVAAHGSRLAVAFLEFQDPREEAALQDFLAAREIPALACGRRLGPGLRVPGEGHPNAVVHAHWGDCIADGLRAQLGDPPEALARLGSRTRARRRASRAAGPAPGSA